MRFLLILLAVIPGSSPFLLGRTGLGTLLLVAGLNAWNLALIGYVIWIGDDARWVGPVGLVGGLLASGGSVVWTIVMTSPARQELLRGIADRALELGMTAYLRGKLPAAQSTIDCGLRRARHDVDLLFVAWKVARDLGDHARARRLLRRLRRADREGKWTWEIETGLQQTPGEKRVPVPVPEQKEEARVV